MTAIVVAIPAHDEAERIETCLDALARQPAASRHIAGVVVFANNCRDNTATIARAMTLPFAIDVIEAELPPEHAHIGWARRGATDAAFARLAKLGIADGIIANTDADSHVGCDWLAAIVADFEHGADAVAGAIDIDPSDAAALAGTTQRRAEHDYAAAVARVNARLDPIEHDPWPNHIWAWGANLAVRARVLAAVGGMPTVNLAEDRALHAALLCRDARVRHSVTARVWTSGRSDGRAPGGFADLLHSYANDPRALADFALEPARAAWTRARLRGQARRLWQRGGAAALAPMAAALGASAPATDRFGAAWMTIAETSDALQWHRVAVADLPGETRKLEGMLDRFSRGSADDRCDTAASPDARHARLRAQSLR